MLHFDPGFAQIETIMFSVKITFMKIGTFELAWFLHHKTLNLQDSRG